MCLQDEIPTKNIKLRTQCRSIICYCDFGLGLDATIDSKLNSHKSQRIKPLCEMQDSVEFAGFQLLTGKQMLSSRMNYSISSLAFQKNLLPPSSWQNIKQRKPPVTRRFLLDMFLRNFFELLLDCTVSRPRRQYCSTYAMILRQMAR